MLENVQEHCIIHIFLSESKQCVGLYVHIRIWVLKFQVRKDSYRCPSEFGSGNINRIDNGRKFHKLFAVGQCIFKVYGTRTHAKYVLKK